MQDTIEQEFEVRKSIHMINAMQLYLSHKYYHEIVNEAIVPMEVLQVAIAEQVVNDIQAIVIAGDLSAEYKKADKYLISHNLDMDDFVTKP